MSHACTLILVGVVCPVSEKLLHSKTAKFAFPTMDYIVHGHHKFNRLELTQNNHPSRD